MYQFADSRTFTEIRVNDLTHQDTIITQMARWLNTYTAQDDSGQYSVNLLLRVTMHANADGEVGHPLPLAPYHVTLTADNNTVMDLATGQFLVIRDRQDDAAAWALKCAPYKDHPTACLQGDYFAHASKNDPVVMDQLARQHMQAAIPMGRYKPTLQP
jgi:hypothetical protein